MGKKPVDENKPKRPANAFLYWAKKTGIREKLMKEKNLKRFADAMKMCGDIWKKMTVEEKAPFQDETNQLLEKYNKEMVKYKQSPSYRKFQKFKEEASWKGKKLKKPKDPNKPKKPLSGYFRFIKHFREQNPEMSITESTKVAAPKWNGFSEDERQGCYI